MALKTNLIKEFSVLLLDLKSEYIKLEKQNKLYTLKNLSIQINAILHFHGAKYIELDSVKTITKRIEIVKSILNIIQDFNKKGLSC